MKIYARQINPECQESPLFICDDFFPDDIAVFGNRDYKEHIPDVVQRVRKVLQHGELSEMLENDKECKQWYPNITAAMLDYLPPEHKEKYSTRDVHALKEYIKWYDHNEEYALCAVLEVVTGQKWDTCQITGSCQCDWNRVYYPVDSWTGAALEGFETEYFNTGSEWIIHDGKDIPEEPDDISGYSVYCTEWNDEGIRRELSSAADCAPEDVILYKYAGSQSVAIYEKAVI